jgi:hypothetical protein
MRDAFFKRLLYATAPLLVWAAHFFIAYLLVAAQCSPALIDRAAPNRWLLGGLSLLAIGACVALLARARSSMARHAGAAPLHELAMAAGAVLATIGIGWSSMVMLMTSGCA